MNFQLKANKLKLAALTVLFIGAARHTPEDLDPQRSLAHVKFLASDSMRGRATGSNSSRRPAFSHSTARATSRRSR